MFLVTSRYAKVWKIFEAKEKYCDLVISTSDKRQDGTREYSRWPSRVIGHAFEQVKAGNIHEGETYAIIKGKLSNVRYTDEEGNYKDNYRLLVSEFAPAGSTESAPTSKKSPAKKPAPAAVDVSAADGDEDSPW